MDTYIRVPWGNLLNAAGSGARPDLGIRVSVGRVSRDPGFTQQQNKQKLSVTFIGCSFCGKNDSQCFAGRTHLIPAAARLVLSNKHPRIFQVIFMCCFGV